MPFIRIETNVPCSAEKVAPLLRDVSRIVAEGVGKPIKYVMARMAPTAPMAFGGQNVPAVYLEIKSVGLTVVQAATLAKTVSPFVSDSLGVPVDNVYIAFGNAEASFWGWGGSLLG